MNDSAVSQCAEQLRMAVSDYNDQVMERLAELGASLSSELGSVANRNACVRELYWALPEIQEAWIVVALGLRWDEFREVVERSEIEVNCDLCHKKIPLLARDRKDRDRIYCLGIHCEDCAIQLQLEKADKYLEQERKQREARLHELKTMPYLDYLQTPEWKAKRELVLERDGHACRLCGSRERLNCHHRTYERRGDEPLDDLTTLCQPCHEGFHANGSLARPAN